MINYNDQNEAVKGCIDELTDLYKKHMTEYPISWNECAWERAKILVMLDKIKKAWMEDMQ